MPNSLRSFIGIDFKASVYRGLFKLLRQQNAASSHSATRWTKPENLHLTLLFLGQQPPDKLDTLARLLSSQLRETKQFEISAEKIGGFPNQHSRIIAAHITPCEPLNKLHQQLKGLADQLEIASGEKAFKPHITLARLKHPQLVGEQPISMSATVASVTLFRSDTQPDGVVYTPLSEIQLCQ